MKHVTIALCELSPRNLVEWIVEKMNNGTLPPAMQKHLCENKHITDYGSLCLWLHRISNPAKEIVGLFTNNSVFEFLIDRIMSESGGGIQEIDFPQTGTVRFSDGTESSTEEDLLKTYFLDYIRKIYDQYTNFENLGVYRDFEKVKKHLSELKDSLAFIKRLSTSPNREDFWSRLEDADSKATQMGKLLERILNSFFYFVREVNLRLSKGETDILEKYEHTKASPLSWYKKEKVLKEFSKDISQVEVDEILQLARIVHNFLNAYSKQKIQENLESMKKTIRHCRNKSAHSKLEIKDLETILHSVSDCIAKLEPVVPRCCHVVHAELSPWITVLKLRMEDRRELVEAYYPAGHLEKYTCFLNYEDVMRASEDIDLLLALPTGSSSYNQFFLVKYGEITDHGDVNYHDRFGSQNSLQELAIRIKLKESPLPEYTHIQEAV